MGGAHCAPILTKHYLQDEIRVPSVYPERHVHESTKGGLHLQLRPNITTKTGPYTDFTRYKLKYQRFYGY